MIRSNAIITFAISLLLWSGQTYSDEPQEYQNCSTVVCPTHGQYCPAAVCAVHGQHCPKIRHRHGDGQPCPLMQGFGQRFGDGRHGAMRTSQPIPMGQPPAGGFLGILTMPRQYQSEQMPADYPQVYSTPPTERIVYIPYAAPPPITVERLGKALPIPRPLTLRRVLGDANMYEYPEMPLHLYTTRGPRDFLAPNPPGIGE